MLVNKRTIHVEWGDCDPLGIVYFPRYFEFFDACTNALFERVGLPKQEMLRKMARAYLKGFPRELRDEVRVRFDVVSVYMMAAGPEFELRRGAFVWE